MRTNTEDMGWPVILIIAGEHDPSGLIIAIARDKEYDKNFYYDVVETAKQAKARVLQLAEKGHEVIGLIVDEIETVPGLEHLPTIKVERGPVEIRACNRVIKDGKQWDVATKKLFEAIGE